jgi:hypothetical protein
MHPTIVINTINSRSTPKMTHDDNAVDRMRLALVHSLCHALKYRMIKTTDSGISVKSGASSHSVHGALIHQTTGRVTR